MINRPTPPTPFERYTRRIDAARGALAKGFYAKSHQKDAMEFCSRAFEDVMDMIGTALLEARDAKTMDDQTKEWRELYYGRPAAHVWSDLRAAKFARWPDLVKLANDAATLRQQCKDATLIPKKPSARAVALAVDDAKRMHCQICARAILAETGLIAHHGYERPDVGYQTSSCAGARQLPYEASRAVILAAIPGAVESEQLLTKYVADLKAERIPATLFGERHEGTGFRRLRFPVRVEFTRETLPFALYFVPSAFDSNSRPYVHDDGTIYDYYGKKKNIPAFDYYLEQAMAAARLLLKQAIDWRKYLERRRDDWKLTHAFHGDDGWKPLEGAG